MKADKSRHAHLHVAAISGGYAYSGEMRFPGQSEGHDEFKSAQSLPKDANSNYRDTLTAIIAALEHLIALAVPSLSHIYIHTNVQGLDKAWKSGAEFWAATGKYIRQDGSPLANADLWETIIALNRRVPLSILFPKPCDRNVWLRLRLVKASASDASTAHKAAA